MTEASLTARATPLDCAREVTAVLAEEAPGVDRAAAFPEASVLALAEQNLLGAAAPAELGGLELSVEELTAIARVLARACSSTAMIWAMHQVQLACVAEHCGEQRALKALLREAIESGGLIASVTTEAGVGGDLRRSRSGCERDGQGMMRLRKVAPTVSYGVHASAFLITARRTPDSPEGDQVLVLADRAQASLEQQSEWNMMGMRGTCSPPFVIEARFPQDQVLPVPFSTIAGVTMVPLSHILWSAVWIGSAEEALARATSFLRKKKSEGGSTELVRASQRLQMLDGLLASTIDCYTREVAPRGVGSREFGVLVNNLKLAASTLSVEIATEALEICGMAGYAEAGPFSIARILRDLYSARLMISNARLTETNSLSLLLERYG